MTGRKIVFFGILIGLIVAIDSVLAGPFTIRPKGYPYPGRGFGNAQRANRPIPIRPAPARRGRFAESENLAHEMIVRHSVGLDCDRLGEMLRRISNEILEANTNPREQRWNEVRSRSRRPDFSKIMLARLTETFRSCDRPCFDDGVAIGIISGNGYCAASAAVGGLGDEGFQEQERLPLCQTANFAGCQQGYTQSVNATQGCLGFATGPFEATYLHMVSRDCHME